MFCNDKWNSVRIQLICGGHSQRKENCTSNRVIIPLDIYQRLNTAKTHTLEVVCICTDSGVGGQCITDRERELLHPRDRC